MATPTPPSSWKMLTGNWTTDAQLVNVGSTAPFGAFQALTLNSTAIATELESDPIPVRSQQSANSDFYYDVSTVYESSSTSSSATFELGVRNFDSTGNLLSTQNLRDNQPVTLDGGTSSFAASTSPVPAGAFYTPPVNTAYVKVFVKKSANLFVLKIHGFVLRPTLSVSGVTTGAANSVPDTNASWTQLTTNSPSSSGLPTVTHSRFYGGTAAAGTLTPLVRGLYLVYAVAKCESIPVGCEFAIRVSPNGSSAFAVEGQRIVSSDATRTYQINALGVLQLVHGQEAIAEVQFWSGSGTEPNISVELIQLYAIDPLPWK